MTRSSSVRGSVTSSARPAWRVSVWCAGPARNASAISGSSPSGSATPHQPNATRRPSRERAHACRCGAISRPGCATPDHGERHLRPSAVGRADPGRRGEDDAADRVGTQHGGAERDHAAERVADPHRADRSPPRPRPPRGRRRRRTSTSRASGSGAEPPWPGRSGTRTRCSRGERRARARASSRPSRRARARARGAARRRRPHSEAGFRATSSSRSSNPSRPGFAVRHHQGIFFGYGCFGRAGRVMLANRQARVRSSPPARCARRAFSFHRRRSPTDGESPHARRTVEGARSRPAGGDPGLRRRGRADLPGQDRQVPLPGAAAGTVAGSSPQR